MLVVGQVLQGRYQITQKLGEGGMGVVYEGFDFRLNSRVAIKETRATDENILRAFRREAQLLANLSHPSLPRVIDHFIEENGQYLVMENIEGDDLKTQLHTRQQPFPTETVLQWADQLLEVLHYLHSQPTPIFHRDIKPGNIKIRNGRLFLLDFGLARGQAGQMSMVTSSVSLRGYTPNFSSPEQIQNQTHTPASDLYSLAATLYILLTNTEPEDSLTRAISVAAGNPDPLVDIRQFKPDLPENVAKVIMQALSLDMSARPQSVRQMQELFIDPISYKTIPLKLDNFQRSYPTIVRSDENQDSLPLPREPENLPPTEQAINFQVPVNYTPPPTQQSIQVPPETQMRQIQPNRFYIQPAQDTSNPPQPDQYYQPTQRPLYEQTAPPRKFPLAIVGGILAVLLISVLGIGLAAWKYLPGIINPQPNPDNPVTIKDEPNKSAGKRDKAIALAAEAETLMQSAKYDDAIKKAKEAIAADPSYAFSYNILGDSLWDTEYNAVESFADMTEVQKNADKIFELTKNPETAEDYAARAWANLAKEKNKDADADATKALELKPNFTAALMARASANSFGDKTDYKKSLADYNEVVRLMPNYAQAISNRASIYVAQKQYKLAISDYTEAIRLLPRANYYKYRGDVYWAQGNYENAKKEYEAALNLDPKYVLAITGIGDYYYQKRKWKEAAAEFTKAIEITPLSFMYNARGNCYYGLKKWNEAIEDYTKAIEIKSDVEYYYSNRANAYREIKKTDLAKADETKAKELKKKK
jgi:serine/threonine protein kinase/tetratricopeptide (TPR) repeat protein